MPDGGLLTLPLNIRLGENAGPDSAVRVEDLTIPYSKWLAPELTFK